MPGFSSEKQRQSTRLLRHEATDAERKMWTLLRNRRYDAYKFRRQFPLGPYIADFCCYQQRLIIELDGGQHGDQAAYDTARTEFMQSHGYRVLRFWNNDVFSQPDSVYEKILQALEAPHPAPPPSPRGEGTTRP